ncbi:MAG TPA: YqgE/AlgH family protein [Bryobacteraceae bacterium]|jgi:putative transcriptional regulator
MSLRGDFGRRWLAGASLLGTLWICLAAPAFAGDELAEGKLLVADQRLHDPNFAQTVVLIVTTDEDGTVGLVLNREGDVPVSKLLRGVKDAGKITDVAFEGGPVEPKSVLTLFRSRTPEPRAQHLGGDVYAVLEQDLLEELLASGAGRERIRFYLGFANWGPGQLEAELDAGAWRVIPGTANAVFDSDPDSLWSRLIQTLDQNVVKNKKPAPPRTSVRTVSVAVRTRR